MDVVTTVEEAAALVGSAPSHTGLLVGVDGFDGTGKTTLAFELARKLSGIRVGLDSYVDKRKEAERYVGLLRLQHLKLDLRNLLRCFPAVVVDGVCLLEALDEIGNAPDALVYVKNLSPQGLWHNGFHLENYVAGEKPGSWLERSVYSYHRRFEPHVRASICYTWAEA